MANWEQLQTKLQELLGSKNVYYQPPENLKMGYPCIRYSKSDIESKYADNVKYSNFDRYEIVVIDRLPDNEVIQKILDLPLSSFDRNYTSDNLYHTIITLYY